MAEQEVTNLLPCPSCAAEEQAAAVVRDLLALMDDGVLIRDTSHDDDYIAYAKQALRITQVIGAAKQLFEATSPPTAPHEPSGLEIFGPGFGHQVSAPRREGELK